MISLRFGFPTCSLIAWSIIGQNVGDFQLIFWICIVSCFEDLYGRPVLSLSLCLSVVVMSSLGHKEVATPEQVGMSSSGVDGS